MVKIQITIINRLGLHARAAAKFITEAGQYSCAATFRSWSDSRPCRLPCCKRSDVGSVWIALSAT
ncbi:MAG: HPr family phosphocarrier protein, partial [Sedimenticola sp.]|nr:HPr family phosphocarrier protein [Sedimenticola sp.]